MYSLYPENENVQHEYRLPIMLGLWGEVGYCF